MASDSASQQESCESINHPVIATSSLAFEDRTINDSIELELLPASYTKSWEKSVPADASFEALCAEHEQATLWWRSSPAYLSSKRLLTETVLNQEKLVISSSMCLCMGSLTAKDDKECQSPWPEPRNRKLA